MRLITALVSICRYHLPPNSLGARLQPLRGQIRPEDAGDSSAHQAALRGLVRHALGRGHTQPRQHRRVTVEGRAAAVYGVFSRAAS
jgi:hypothetical protein